MFKKSIVSYFVTIIIVLYLIIVASGYVTNLKTKRIEYQELRISKWNYELKELGSDRVKFTYTFSLINCNTKNEFIISVKPTYKKEIENTVEYDDYIAINKEIKPNEEIEISWDIIVNTDGLKKADVKEVKTYLTSVTVSAKNHNSYHTFYPYN